MGLDDAGYKENRAFIRETLNNMVLEGDLYRSSSKRYSYQPALEKHSMHLQVHKRGDDYVLIDPIWKPRYNQPYPQVVVSEDVHKLQSFADNKDIYVDARVTRQDDGTYQASILNAYNIKTSTDLSAPFRPEIIREPRVLSYKKQRKEEARQRRGEIGAILRQAYHERKDAEKAAKKAAVETEKAEQKK